MSVPEEGVPVPDPPATTLSRCSDCSEREASGVVRGDAES